MPTSFTYPDYSPPPPLPAGHLPPPVIDLAYPPSPSPAECSLAAVLAWERHILAGRIGTPPPPITVDDLRLASLARILGRAPEHAE